MSTTITLPDDVQAQLQRAAESQRRSLEEVALDILANAAGAEPAGFAPEDVEDVLFDPVGHDRSRSSGLPIAFGFTSDGRYIAVVYEQIDPSTVYPLTAYEVAE